MRVWIQSRGDALLVSFEGANSRTGDGYRRESAICRHIDAEIWQRKPRALLVDFRDLRCLDGVSLRAFLVYFGDLSARMPVRFVGPGPALRRLWRLLSSLPAVKFYPSVAAALTARAQSIRASSSAWRAFVEEFDEDLARSIGLPDFREGCSRTFVVDLEEETDHLSRQRHPSFRTPPKTLEFRRSGARDTRPMPRRTPPEPLVCGH